MKVEIKISGRLRAEGHLWRQITNERQEEMVDIPTSSSVGVAVLRPKAIGRYLAILIEGDCCEFPNTGLQINVVYFIKRSKAVARLNSYSTADDYFNLPDRWIRIAQYTGIL